MGEYGNPDVPEDWAVLQTYSPYQNVAPNIAYPAMLFYTSTLDDRVHPGHARKMAATLESYGLQFEYMENIEGGHGGVANQQQSAHRLAMEFAFFARELGLRPTE
jgi:prolyl oligopeptidase